MNLDSAITWRAKWLADGATTISEMIQRLEQEIASLEMLQSDGWELDAAVEDDYGTLMQGFE